MNNSRRLKRLLGYIGILLVIALVLSTLWNRPNGWQGSEIFTGIGVLMVAGAMMYLKQMENKAERNVAQRIGTEYPSESQQQVFAIYERLKIKELEGPFLKILDESKGDIKQVEKLASVAEGVDWKAFLENHW